MKKSFEDLTEEEIHITTSRRKRKNGDVYVYRQYTYYDKDAGYSRTVKSELIGKYIGGNGELVNTRPKRKSVSKLTAAQKINNIEKAGNEEAISAVKIHTGMMDIIAFAGEQSGIDEDIMNSTDFPTAQKILSMARFMVANQSDSLAGVEEFQYTHMLPYEDGLNKDVYYNLFKELGYDETLRQSFFRYRIDREDDAVLFVAYDSTTQSTDSRWLKSARYGMNKAHDGKKSVKFVVVYSMKTGMPLCYYQQEGNIPDVITLDRLLEQLSALGIKRIILVADNGYYSAQNINSILSTGNEILTRVETDTAWVRDVLLKEYDRLLSVSNALPDDYSTHGLCVEMIWDELKSEDGLPKDTPFNLILYHNLQLAAEEKAALSETLHRYKTEIEEGRQLESYRRSERTLINKCLKIKHTQAGVTVAFNDRGIKEESKLHGTFALFSTGYDDPLTALRFYRKRGEIESMFRVFKEDVAGQTPCVSWEDTLDGKLFVEFVALCYEEYLSNRINKMKRELAVPNGDADHDKKRNLDNEKALKRWLESRSLKRILSWFDTNNRIIVSRKMETKKWNSETIARDRLFLKQLGICEG